MGQAKSKRRVLFCWDVVNGYMAACWRELARRSEIDLRVYAIGADSRATTFVYSSDLLSGLSIELFDRPSLRKPAVLVERTEAWRPDVIFVAGWSFPAYLGLIKADEFARAGKVMTMDTNWKGTLRQYLAPILFGRLLGRFDLLFVPGERSWQLARHWNVPVGKLRRGSYGMDFIAYATAMENRVAHGSWPKRFVFAGQYIERKGLVELLEAYTEYRQDVPQPWPLVCCGRGPLANRIADTAGVEDLGFSEPGQLPSVLAGCGAFLHPSRYDAWGVAIAEAAAAGLPIVATETCGASVEVVRHGYNGRLVPPGDRTAIKDALLWLHERYDLLPTLGARSQELARPFGADLWADRVQEIVRRLSA